MESDTIQTPEGDLVIRFVGHSSLIFFWAGKNIHADPVSLEADYARLPKADVILITHGHGDHMDVNAVVYCEADSSNQKMIREKAALNLKRVSFYDKVKWAREEGQSPYFIMDFQEIKTTWHPIENIGGAKAGY